MNILFEYLYRDAGNNKLWGEILLSNREGMDVRRAEDAIRSSLIDGEFFVAEDVGIAPLRFENRDHDLDHGWHEFHALQAAYEARGEEPLCDLADCLQKMKAASEKWKRVS